MKHIKTVVVVIFIALLVLGYFYYISNIRNAKPSEADTKTTKVQEVIMKNLDTWYPPTPKEVIKFYAEISQCLYNESFTEEELTDMVKQLQRLYDEELLERNPLDKYIENLKFDIQSMKDKSYTISSYTVSGSTDVEYYFNNGSELAKLHCIFFIRAGTQMAPPSDHLFVLRKDAEGHWKIVGWTLAETENADENKDEV